MESSPQPASSSTFNPAYYCSLGLLRFCDPATTPLYPEPPSPVFAVAAADSPSESGFSPLRIGSITVLAAAILLLSCYIFVAYKYCKRRRGSRLSRNQEEDDSAATASLQSMATSSSGIEPRGGAV